jgi:arylsulfatase A-like enzyme
MQTGLYWHAHGVVKNDIRLDYSHVTIAEILRDAGYATGYVGKWHLDGGKPKERPGGFVPPGEARQGWDEWHGYEIGQEYFDVWEYDDRGVKVRVEGYDWEPTWQTDLALDFARRHSEAGRPWRYYVSYGPPHKPAQCPQEFLDRFPPEAFRLPADVDDTPELRRVWQMYYAQVTALDVEVGRILKGLDDLGVADNTIIVYTSDHGDLLGSLGKVRGKSAPHPDAFRIPFIVRWPQRIEPNQVTDALISSVDFVPTILELAGLPVAEHMQGVSMAGWALHGTGPQPDGGSTSVFTAAVSMACLRAGGPCGTARGSSPTTTATSSARGARGRLTRGGTGRPRPCFLSSRD